VMSALADSVLAKSDCKGINGHQKCKKKDECQWAFKKIGAKSKSCIDYVKVKVPKAPVKAPVPAVTVIIDQVTDVDATAEYTFLKGCCREKESGDAHHDKVEKLNVVGANKKDAMDQCEKACDNKNGKCGAYEFTEQRQSKKKNKKSKSTSTFKADCELHMHKNIDSATKSSVSCRKRATCAVRPSKSVCTSINTRQCTLTACCDVFPTWEMYWQELSPSEQDGATVLGWEQSSWDHERGTTWPNNTHVPWANLTTAEQEGATKLNFDAESWKTKCPLDHDQRKAYEQDFAGLTDSEQEGAVALGWNETTWDADENNPSDWSAKTFDKLTEDERAGAYKLHWCDLTWNSQKLMCPNEASRINAWKNLYWDDLSGASFASPTLAEFQTSATGLGWDETTWNEESGTIWPTSEFTLWADLTEAERGHAVALDFCEVGWDFHVAENQECRTGRKYSHCILVFGAEN